MNTQAIRDFMGRKFLGIPAGVFVLLFAAVILFFAWRSRNTANAAATDTTATDTSSDPTGDQTAIQQPDFSAVPSDGTSSTPVVTTTATNDTNDMWQRRTIEWLMSNGFSVAVATNAISKYLAGDPLTVQEAKARDEAIAQFGLPPESIPDIIKNSPQPKPRLSDSPAVAQGKPPLSHEVKGSRDNTPAELAVLYYGTNSADAQNKIRSANDRKVVPYAVGDKVRIPENYDPKYYRATGHVRTLYDIARVNGSDPARIEALNPHMKFPVDVGTRVRVR